MRRLLRELLALIPGSMLAGYIIGTIQHFVMFGFSGFGFSTGALWDACFEGGIIGAVFGIPTGLITFYLALRRRVTGKVVVIVVSGSLVLGCVGSVVGERIVGDGFIPLSTLASPPLTLVIALAVRLHAAPGSRE